MTSAFGDFTGTWRGYLNWLTIGLWLTKFQINVLKDPNSSITCVAMEKKDVLKKRK